MNTYSLLIFFKIMYLHDNQFYTVLNTIFRLLKSKKIFSYNQLNKIMTLIVIFKKVGKRIPFENILKIYGRV